MKYCLIPIFYTHKKSIKSFKNVIKVILFKCNKIFKIMLDTFSMSL